LERLKKIKNRMKERWGVKRDIEFLIILIVFALTGSTSLKVTEYLKGLAGLDEGIAWYWDVCIWVFGVFPIYQVLLLLFGFIFGQFHFFWEQEKKIFRWFGKILHLN